MAQYVVLIVDDDLKIAELLRSYFEKYDFTPYLAHDGNQALQLVREKRPDILILDLMLPDLTGYQVCQRVRQDYDIPILMLSARDEETDRLLGLELGADDYVTKPFSPREVVARAKAILRRTHKPAAKLEPKRTCGLEIDTVGHSVLLKGKALDLTRTEFNILELFANNPGRVFTRLQIVEKVQGYAFEGYERTIDAHIKNLRRKLEDNPKEPKFIQTVYGIGYKLAGDDRA